MADYRSNFYDDSSMQIEPYSGPNGFRSYSTSYNQTAADLPEPPQKLKKGKSTGSSISKSWSFNDPELQRKKRVASYKSFTVEGKVKGSFRKSFRWIKDRCNLLVHGFW